MGVNLPPLWPHQERVLRATNHLPKLMYLHSPRLGKSRVTIEWLCSLRALEGPGVKVLITAPLVVCPQWIAMLLASGIASTAAYSMSATKVAAMLKLETCRVSKKDCKQCQIEKESLVPKKGATKNLVKPSTAQDPFVTDLFVMSITKSDTVREGTPQSGEIRTGMNILGRLQDKVGAYTESLWKKKSDGSSLTGNPSTTSTVSEMITAQRTLSFGSELSDSDSEQQIYTVPTVGKHTCKPQVLVMNDDKLAVLEEALLKWGPEVYIGDESHRFRTPSSARGKAMRKVAWQAKYVRLLTGTPTPNNIGNLWGQFAAIDRELWGKSYAQFAKKYLIRDSMFPSKILGVLHADELRQKVEMCSSIVNRSEVFGPDQWQNVTRDVVLPPKAQKLYKDLVKQWVVENHFEKGEVIDVTHTLKRMTRLQQLTSGFIVDEDGNEHLAHSAKTDLVMNDLEEIIESGEKVVIFHKFTAEGTEIYERARRQFGPARVFKIAGHVSSKARETAIGLFNTSPGAGIFVIQTQSGGIGISLASALHVFFVSQGFSYDDEKQARDRVYKPGCGRCVSFYRVNGSIDDYISRVLERKENVQEAVLTSSIEEIAFGEVKADKGTM